ncbi:OmpW/AlkL family protein [Pseudooceanicola spongiae]|uniref:Outer membrane beta-barrel protein n=1 Tax=Pseudooceanicola spongiae TaxID=2613965 RepID=A0A7L9WM89_9RHOB|nr:OmpW family outer membrane protein [Pseudooceanicola spongiae]QOL80648.1 outer membrane beta-barrel protein [Pseudooceanicola spongiae]
MTMKTLLLTATALVALTGPAAMAQSKGDVTVGLGIGYVDPTSDNGTLAGSKLSIGSDTQPTLTVEYFLTDTLGLELLAATPFTHDLSLGGTRIGTVKQLPPTISINYHYANATAFTPLVGIGLNYTTALDVSSPLGKVTLEDSWGVAAHLGVDYAITPTSAIRTDLRWIDINMDTRLNGARIGTAEVDPVIFGMSYIMTF